MLKLKVQKRGLDQKVKALRKEGMLPGVLYGPLVGKESIPVMVDLKEFKKVFKEAGESSLIELDLEGKAYQALIHDFQLDPLSLEFIHVDFYAPSFTEEVESFVPLVFEGEAPAVSKLGGTLVKNLQELKVRALPQDLPSEIKVNLSSLDEFHKGIKVKDLQISSQVKVLADPEQVIVTVIPPEDVEAELDKPIEEDFSQIQVEKRKKEESD